MHLLRACLTKNSLCTPHRALVDFRRISGRYFASECVVNACLTVDTHSFPPSTPSKYYDCDAICLSMPSNLPSHAFFLDVIEEIYDQNTPLSIYPKKIFMHLNAWPVMPYIVGGLGTRHSISRRDATCTRLACVLYFSRDRSIPIIFETTYEYCFTSSFPFLNFYYYLLFI